MRFNPILRGNLTRGDGSMKVRLNVLPDEPRGSAWPPSARAVRCPAKSGNERDLYLQLLTILSED